MYLKFVQNFNFGPSFTKRVVSKLPEFRIVAAESLNSDTFYTDKKERENKIPNMYKEIHKGAVAKSYITNGLLIQYMTKNLRISSYIWKPFLMTLLLLPSEFPYIWGKFYFLLSDARFFNKKPPYTVSVIRIGPSLLLYIKKSHKEAGCSPDRAVWYNLLESQCGRVQWF